MKKFISVCLAATAVLCIAPSHAAPVDITGRWIIDLAPMVAEMKAKKAPAKAIASMEETFRGGIMTIDAKAVKLSVAGYDGQQPVTLKYKMVSSTDNCATMLMDGSPRPIAYCLVAGGMQVKDPTAGMTQFYRRH
ncbi:MULTISPECIES: hypothetical protein [Massilia]|uniref:hypothetical protein n=1 Tax=Massilia TaxID=149698 RepID=UPI0027966E7E|nr:MULTISPECIES: hypothetical protein [unclassified Massilia]MDQ1834030.1 hypothetical protein [Massilia sp. CCM 9029]MDQ1922213.1 hypothetical protein [Massilia sp. CCM 9206]